MDAPLKVPVCSETLDHGWMLKQELAALDKKCEALAFDCMLKQEIAMQSAQLSQQNMFLGMQPQSWVDPMLTEQQWWAPMNSWMPSQAGYAPAYTADRPPTLLQSKATSPKSKNNSRKKKIVVDEDAGSLSSGFGTESTFAGSNVVASSTGEEDRPEVSLAQESTPPLLTTVMMRNIPSDTTREMLLDLFNIEGFEGCYNFVYLPMDFKHMVGLGYSFINFLDVEDAQRFKEHFAGFRNWGNESDKVCEMTWSNVLQGTDAHIERYRNSPVMHHSMPDACKPVLFKDGKRVAFPEPTKRIRAPPHLKKNVP